MSPGEQPDAKANDEAEQSTVGPDRSPPTDETPPEAPTRRWLPWLWRTPAIVLGLTVLLVLPFRWIAPPTSTSMVWHGGPEARDKWEWVALEDISPEVAIAVIASEDQRFPVHHGIDFAAIRDALGEGDGRPRGASTISQQVAKNLYLWGGRSWIRKGLEAYLTLSIEALWPKARILEMYLNLAQFGPTTFGVGAAGPEFFGVPASDLSRRQASLLAVVLPSPRRMSPAEPSVYVEERAAWVREQVRTLGGTGYLETLR